MAQCRRCPAWQHEYEEVCASCVHNPESPQHARAAVSDTENCTMCGHGFEPGRLMSIEVRDEEQPKKTKWERACDGCYAEKRDKIVSG